MGLGTHSKYVIQYLIEMGLMTHFDKGKMGLVSHLDYYLSPFFQLYLPYCTYVKQVSKTH